MNHTVLLLGALFCSAASTPAQQMDQTGQAPQRNVYQVELSIPFGVVPGTLVASGEYMVFIDQQQLGNTFVIPKRDLATFNFDGDLLKVDLRSPVRDRSGARSNLTFRVPDQSGTGPLAAWLRAQPAGGTTAAIRTDEPGAAPVVYQARHNHMIGDCTGRLIIGKDRVAYESVNNINDSRQWSLSDIRELKRDGPYKLEVNPYVGNTYKLELMGQAMDNSVYKALVDRIAAARVSR